VAAQTGWIAGTLQTSSVSGGLNAKAALWTAVAVALGAASTVVGNLAN
jgi:hypothetical protein